MMKEILSVVDLMPQAGNLINILGSPSMVVSSSLITIIFTYGCWKAYFHPVALMHVNYEDPITLYAFLNQTCGTIAIPIGDGSTTQKLIQQFPGVDIQNFINRHWASLPHEGAGLVEAQHQLANSSQLWMLGRTPPVSSKQSFIEYFIQDAQITGLIQASNGYFDFGLYNLAIDATLFGATIVGIPLICYYVSDIALGLANTVDSVVTNPLSIECLKWWGSALTSITLVKSLCSLSECALIMPCKMVKFLQWGAVYECKPLSSFSAAIYKTATTDVLKYPVVINENLVFNRVLTGNYSPINPLFLMRTDCLAPLGTTVQSLSFLSNLGWDVSSALNGISSTSALLNEGNIMDCSDVGTSLKNLRICGR